MRHHEPTAELHNFDPNEAFLKKIAQNLSRANNAEAAVMGCLILFHQAAPVLLGKDRPTPSPGPMGRATCKARKILAW